jgi:DNA/RNA-binding domain of Phe-tRNA-synthetase-like protein
MEDWKQARRTYLLAHKKALEVLIEQLPDRCVNERTEAKRLLSEVDSDLIALE